MFVTLLLAALASLPAHAAKVYSGESDGFASIKLDVGGFVQPRFVFVPEDEDAGTVQDLGFAVRRARIETASSFLTDKDGVDGWSGFGLATKLTFELMPEAKLLDASADLRIAHPLQLRMGQFKAPGTRNYLVSSSALAFQDETRAADLAPKREIGAQLMGFVGHHHLDYAVGVFNGEGTNRLSNVNDKVMVAGRIEVSPLGGPKAPVEVLPQSWRLKGDKAAVGEKNPDATVTLGGHAFRNVEGTDGEREGTWGVGADLFFHYRHLNLTGTWLTGAVQWEDEAVADSTFGGWSGSLVLFPPAVPWAQDHLALLTRVEQADALIPGDVDVPLTGPTDPAAGTLDLAFGLELFAGTPWYDDLHGSKASLTYTVRQETEGAGYDNDELLLATQLAF